MIPGFAESELQDSLRQVVGWTHRTPWCVGCRGYGWCVPLGHGVFVLPRVFRPSLDSAVPWRVQVRVVDPGQMLEQAVLVCHCMATDKGRICVVELACCHE